MGFSTWGIQLKNAEVGVYLLQENTCLRSTLQLRKKKKEFFLVKRRQQSSRSSLKLCGFLYFKVFLKTSIPPFGAPFLHKGVAVYTTVFLTAQEGTFSDQNNPKIVYYQKMFNGVKKIKHYIFMGSGVSFLHSSIFLLYAGFGFFPPAEIMHTCCMQF